MNKNSNTPVFKLVSLNLYPVGGYVDQVRYPYAPSDVSQGVNVLSRICDPRQSVAITPEFIAGFATELLTHNVTPSPTDIVGGWYAERYSFKLVVNSAGFRESTYVFQGYTENQEITPESKFYINSVSEFVHVVHYSPLGDKPTWILSKTMSMLSEKGIAQPDTIPMRPGAVFARLSVNELRAETGQDIIDMRFLLQDTPHIPKRESANMSYYLTSILSAYTNALSLSQLGAGDDVLSRACSYAYEPSAVENPVLRALSLNVNQAGPIDTFTLSQLEAVIGERCVYVREILDINDERGVQTQGSGSKEDRVAYQLAMAIPALLSSLSLQAGTVMANTLYTATPDTYIINIQHQHTSEDIGRATAPALFKKKFEEMILPTLDIDFKTYELKVVSDLYTDTVVELRFNDWPVRRYRFPTFADSLLSPMLMSGTQADELAEQFDEMFCILSQTSQNFDA